MNYGRISKFLFAAGIAVIVLAAIIGISQGLSRSDLAWVFIPAVVLVLAGMGTGRLGRKQEKERVAKELERKRQ